MSLVTAVDTGECVMCISEAAVHPVTLNQNMRFTWEEEGRALVVNTHPVR